MNKKHLDIAADRAVIITGMTPQRELQQTLLQLKKLEHALRTTQPPPNPATAQRTEEYRFLRNEMEAIWGQTYTTLNFFVAFIGVTIGAIFVKDLQQYDRFTLLVTASCITVAGYRIIGLHTKRVWRITTYMRRALEPNLLGIAWETRLYVRHLLRNKGDAMDRSLFEAHMLVFHMINALLVGLILLTPICPNWLRYAGASVTILIFIVSVSKGYKLRRHGSFEKEQFLAWGSDFGGPNTPIYAFRPDIDEIPKVKASKTRPFRFFNWFYGRRKPHSQPPI